ncbi:BrnA antitoxin family protein [Jiella sp. M17.18]|uniref:BrnA antitoxin family protein n=1 Tax=Jiella sp. M17.18 TaxID=3234247 RepID=UPI0034DE3F43
MSVNPAKPSPAWIDPDDAPEWAEEQFARAEVAENGVVIEPAKGTLTRGPGRPPLERPKQRVTVRLDQDVALALRESGRGWQTRMNAALRQWLALDGDDRR